jgi:hypothetical protein
MAKTAGLPAVLYLPDTFLSRKNSSRKPFSPLTTTPLYVILCIVDEEA